MIPTFREWEFWFFVAAVLICGLLAFCGCSPAATSSPPVMLGKIPLADIPVSLRTRNYAGGSCYHAATGDVLTAQDRPKTAEWWCAKYRGGETTVGIVAKANREGLRVAYTSNGDASFLDWCSRTRRPAAIYYYSSHAVTFLGFDQGYAVLINNNSPSREVRIPKAEFLSRWRGYGGDAVTVVYSPILPTPILRRTDP